MYCLDGAGKIRSFELIAAADDDDQKRAEEDISHCGSPEHHQPRAEAWTGRCRTRVENDREKEQSADQ